MRGDQSAERTVVVIGEGSLGVTTAGMLASAAIRREGWSLLAPGAPTPPGTPTPPPGRGGVTVVHRLARGNRGLVIATAAIPLHWAEVLDRADQVVIATTTADHESAATKLMALRGWGGDAAELASGAVVVLTRADPSHPAPSEVVPRFRGLARSTLVVPHSAQASTDPLQQSTVPPAARTAWDGVIQLVGHDEVSEDEMDTQPRIDVRDLFAGQPGATPGSGPTPFAPARPTHRRGRWALLAVAAALVVALAAIPFVLGGGLPWGQDSAATPGLAPVDPVHGWTSQAEWVSPDIAARGLPPTVLVAQGAAITTTGDATSPDLTALSTADGEQLWTSPIDGELTAPPQLISWLDQPAVVAATATDLYLWTDLASAERAPSPRTWSFTETGMRLVPGSPVPLLASEDTLTALVLHDGSLRRRSIPSGGRPIAADFEGRVLSVASTGHWWSSDADGELTDGKLLAPPSYGSLPGDILGVAGTTLVVNWSRNNRTTHLAGYDVMDQMDETWTSTVPGRVRIDDFDVAPDGTWATAGTVALDLATGKDKDLGDDWQTVGMAGDRAWSRTDVTDRTGRTTPLPEPVADPTGVPVAVTGNGLGLIVASEAGGPARIYALRPDPDA